VPIQVIYPNRAFQIEQGKAVESQQSLRDEAEEHYQLLKSLSQVDAEYQMQLKVSYERKNEVKSTLGSSTQWKYFLRRLSQNK